MRLGKEQLLGKTRFNKLYNSQNVYRTINYLTFYPPECKDLIDYMEYLGETLEMSQFMVELN